MGLGGSGGYWWVFWCRFIVSFVVGGVCDGFDYCVERWRWHSIKTIATPKPENPKSIATPKPQNHGNPKACKKTKTKKTTHDDIYMLAQAANKFQNKLYFLHFLLNIQFIVLVIFEILKKLDFWC